MQISAVSRWLHLTSPSERGPAAEPAAGPVDRMSSGPVCLLSSEGALAFPQDGSVFLIGRDAQRCQVPVHDDSVSRAHAWGCYRNGQLYVQDAGSSNGTRVNGQPVDKQHWTPVKGPLQLGDLQLQLGPPPAVTAPTPLARPTGSRPPQGLPAQAVATPALSPPGVAVAFSRQPISLDQLRQEAQSPRLDSKPVLETALSQATGQMASTPGVVQLPKDVPTLVITDIHGRRDYLERALEKVTPDGQRVYDLLKEGKLNVLCLGDGMHGEGRVADRWKRIDAAAMESLAKGQGLGPQALGLMDQEMLESLGTMKMVMDLKNSFPEHFHFLRGNHEEIKGQFYKYARVMGESTLANQWMTERLGSDFVDRYEQFEDSMPLVAVGQGFVASHAAPARALSRQEVDARTPDATKSLTWTENSTRDESGRYTYETPQHLQVLQGNLEQLGNPGAVWFCGHRPVHQDEHQGRYRSQFSDRLVQLNNPDQEVVAWVSAGGGFSPDQGVTWL